MKTYSQFSIPGRILRACATPQGMSLVELYAAIGCGRSTARSRVIEMRDAGVLYSAGWRGALRYFSNPVHCEAWAAANAAEIAAVAAERALPAAERERAKRERAQAQRRAKVEQRKAEEAAEAARRQAVRMATANPASPWRRTRSRSLPPLPIPGANVPAHVRVQVIPHCVDQRFTFTPPPGWVGQITADWLARRQEGGK